ncbi:MAG: hypothetical protein KF689_03465 [Gemmatimonadaceae bacterium]|nr:hypothetical protein [Gemmatimonadaceae bacterium]
MLSIGESRSAVRLARQTSRLVEDPFSAAMSLGGILIDAGAQLGNRRLVAEGRALIESVGDDVPSEYRAAYHYNLGNGYAETARFERGRGPWRRIANSRAISELDESLRSKESPDTRTNLATSFRLQWRLFEALDEYETVLLQVPNHHQSVAMRAGCLVQLSHWLPQHAALLLAAYQDYDRAVELAGADIVFADSYRKHRDALARHVRHFPLETVTPSDYQKWIWSSRLALNPCPLCRVDTPAVFDLFPLQGHFSAPRRSVPVDLVLDMVNRLCQGYATARWHLYAAVSKHAVRESEHQVYVPTGSGAEFGLSSGLLMSACTAFFSLLNNVAYAVNVYFRLGLAPQAVTLESIWHRKDGARSLPSTESDMRRRLYRTDNHGLTALFELTRSLERGKGRYSHLRELRHGIEHRLVLSHSSVPGAKSELTLVDRSTLEESAFALGRVAKAAVWYFSAAVLHEERRRARRAALAGEQIRHGTSPSVRRA